jgi:hypothetical protein
MGQFTFVASSYKMLWSKQFIEIRVKLRIFYTHIDLFAKKKNLDPI